MGKMLLLVGLICLGLCAYRMPTANGFEIDIPGMGKLVMEFIRATTSQPEQTAATDDGEDKETVAPEAEERQEKKPEDAATENPIEENDATTAKGSDDDQDSEAIGTSPTLADSDVTKSTEGNSNHNESQPDEKATTAVTPNPQDGATPVKNSTIGTTPTPAEEPNTAKESNESQPDGKALAETEKPENTTKQNDPEKPEQTAPPSRETEPLETEDNKTDNPEEVGTPDPPDAISATTVKDSDSDQDVSSNGTPAENEPQNESIPTEASKTEKPKQTTVEAKNPSKSKEDVPEQHQMQNYPKITDPTASERPAEDPSSNGQKGADLWSDAEKPPKEFGTELDLDPRKIDSNVCLQPETFLPTLELPHDLLRNMFQNTSGENVPFQVQNFLNFFVSTIHSLLNPQLILDQLDRIPGKIQIMIGKFNQQKAEGIQLVKNKMDSIAESVQQKISQNLASVNLCDEKAKQCMKHVQRVYQSYQRALQNRIGSCVGNVQNMINTQQIMADNLITNIVPVKGQNRESVTTYPGADRKPGRPAEIHDHFKQQLLRPNVKFKRYEYNATACKNHKPNLFTVE
ncbi:cell surface glycoprotein 1-like [Wyeomyia smithii]|uniref:cell surface glycoprotein 1-like n=1 Tax=Wyeomyia smithii TaxID=174621 RepID=UPI002467B44A|nr:cell surface glycoprotein 1-like [Wyeomyia smithii]